MLNWMRKILKEWLADDKALNFEMDCYVSENNKLERKTYYIIGAKSVYLEGIPFGQQDMRRLIRIEEVKDKKQFTDLWMYFCKDKQITWEDGTPYVPGS